MVGGSMMADWSATVRQALENSSDCACDAHRALLSVGASLDAAQEVDVSARRYDLRQLDEDWVGGLPDASWSTAALVLRVRSGILTPPWVDPLRRSISVTQSLGLLGERGLHADAYVRSYLVRPLTRRIVGEATHAYLHRQDVKGGRDDYPPQVTDWFDDIEALRGSTARAPEVLAAVFASPMMDRAAQWISSAAMAHIVDWRSVDYLSVQSDARDLVLPGGTDATNWVFDRFSLTSMAEWRRGSVEWELAFAQEPQRVSDFVGVPRAVLDERPTSLELALTAQLQGLVSIGGREEVAKGVYVTEMIEQILAALRLGDFDRALREARKAHSMAPHEFVTTNALAFCLVAIQPGEVVDLLNGVSPRGAEESGLIAANQASALVRLGRRREAEQLLTMVTGDTTAYLWGPSSLVEEIPTVDLVSMGAWAEDLRRRLRREDAS